MNVNVTKILLYVVLVVMAVYAGRGFVARYARLMATNVDADPLELLDSRPAEVAPQPGPDADTNQTAQVNPSPTNTTAAGTPDASVTPPGTNTTQQAGAAPHNRRPEGEGLTKRSLERSGPAVDVSGIGFYAVALFGTLIGLGVLAAHDVSALLGQKAHKLLHNEEGEGIHSVDYDRAEEVWASGQHLEAIRLMREYLTKNPREVHVMARIAEIYEKDLGNHLAAALEYEEFLKQKIPAERWGWAAIHLVNLYYGKLDKPDQGLALLWRIHREYGQTQAAAKARKRLLQIDPSFAPEQARLDREAAEAAAGADEDTTGDDDTQESSVETGTRVYQLDEADLERTTRQAAAARESAEADSHLPKGFRPKKR